MCNPDMPCGCCDMGTYSIEASMNIVARRFAAMPEDDRAESIPMCKRHNRKCVGATHFHEAIKLLDEDYLTEKRGDHQ